MMKNKLSLMLSCCVAILSIALLSSVSSNSYAAIALQDESEAISPGERKTRRVPALRSRVYEQLSRAQTAGDAGNVGEAIEILDEVKDKQSSMNAYEQSMMYNFYGFIYYNSDQLDKAIESFELAVQQQPIPEKYEQTTLFSLAQLHMAQGNFDESIRKLEQWEALNNGVIPPKNYVLKAQAHYQNKNYSESARYIEQAIEGHEAEGYLPDEGWLILQRAVYYEMKQPEKVKEILAKMIRLYDNPKYWIQLAGMYGELGQEKKQLAMMESAYQMGYVESASDIFNFAQLYYYHEAPYKAAALMEQGIKNGVLEANLRNLKFLSICWTAAKEKDKAIPVLIDAAELSEDGELDAQLGHLYYNSDQFDKAIEASSRAIEKGGLANQGAVHMVIGLAHYNQKRYALALDELAKAEAFKSSRAAAQQWGRFVGTEKSEKERLEAELNSI
ncbi:tetratricopeptide repeat protein [Brumicola blandensis]|uniref:Tetratricopeptide repeat protein n=1 Tax=Brumicola blandensis TaxID=3075611 RepID=A0AAW8R2B0_9ALTE|nr:tetratricopeptide repeat protein [Alteromonas sp. W409]MDT0583149.1 tetratricopeptide repeat protein [Alteromonas sp. W409]